MAGILDKIADEIANAIDSTSPPVEEAEIEIEKPIPITSESEGELAIYKGRGFGDLQRFILPQIMSPDGVNAIEGSSNLALQFLGRRTRDALKVIFPEPIYGIWLDPFWSSPGTQVGIAYSNESRGNFFALTPGEGIRFTTPIREIRIINADGFEQIPGFTPASYINFPYGFVSFLVAISKDALWNGTIPKGHSNVSSEIQAFGALVPGVLPLNPANAVVTGAFASAALKSVSVDVLAAAVGNTPANGGFAVTFTAWKMSTFSAARVPSPVTAIDVFSPDFGGVWVKDRPLTKSCFVNPSTTDNSGFTLEYQIPSGCFASLIWPNIVVLDSASNAIAIYMRIRGNDR